MEWINAKTDFMHCTGYRSRGWQTESVCENHTFPGTITLSSMHCGLCLSAPLWRSEDKERDGVSIFPRRQFLIVLLLLSSAMWRQQCVFTKWWHIPCDETDGICLAIPHTSGQSLNWSQHLPSTFPSVQEHHPTLPHQRRSIIIQKCGTGITTPKAKAVKTGVRIIRY